MASLYYLVYSRLEQDSRGSFSKQVSSEDAALIRNALKYQLFRGDSLSDEDEDKHIAYAMIEVLLGLIYDPAEAIASLLPEVQSLRLDSSKEFSNSLAELLREEGSEARKTFQAVLDHSVWDPSEALQLYQEMVFSDLVSFRSPLSLEESDR